jgi:hypothetical protein
MTWKNTHNHSTARWISKGKGSIKMVINDFTIFSHKKTDMLQENRFSELSLN